MAKIYGISGTAFENPATENGLPAGGNRLTPQMAKDLSKLARSRAANEAQAYKVAQAFAKAGVPANNTREAQRAASKFAHQFAKAAAGPNAEHVRRGLDVVAKTDADPKVRMSAGILKSMVPVARPVASRDLAAGIDQVINQADLNVRKGAIQTERDHLAELQGFNSAATNFAAAKGLDVAELKTVDRSDDLAVDSQKDSLLRNRVSNVIAMIPTHAPLQDASIADSAEAEAAASLAASLPEAGNIAPAADLGAARAAREAANQVREQAEEAAVKADPEPSPEVKALADSTITILAVAVTAPVAVEVAIEAAAAPIMEIGLSLAPAPTSVV